MRQEGSEHLCGWGVGGGGSGVVLVVLGVSLYESPTRQTQPQAHNHQTKARTHFLLTTSTMSGSLCLAQEVAFCPSYP